MINVSVTNNDKRFIITLLHLRRVVGHVTMMLKRFGLMMFFKRIY